MKSSPHIGRVGGLAVALGIGAAMLTNQGVACAETGSSDGSASSSNDGTSASVSKPSAAKNSKSTVSSTSHGSSSKSEAAATKADRNDSSEADGDADGQADTSAPEQTEAPDSDSTGTDSSEPAEPEGTDLPESPASDAPERESADQTQTAGSTGSDQVLTETPSIADVPEVSAAPESAPVNTASETQPETTTVVTSQSSESAALARGPATATATATATASLVTASAASSPLFASDTAPANPATTPNIFTLLAEAIRRQFFNTPAAANPLVTGYTNGQLTGNLNATDPSGDAITYLTLATQSVRGGTVTVDPATGAFVYTPSADMINSGGGDRFTVYVSDDPSGTTFYGPVDLLAHIPIIGPVIRSVAVSLGLLPQYTSKVPITVYVPPLNPLQAPSGTLTETDALKVNELQFMSQEQLRAWHEHLDAIGLRATGSAAQEGYVDDLIQMFYDAGLNPEDVTTQDVPFQRWSLKDPESPNAYQLNVIGADGTVTRINAPAYMPYSGATDADGRTAELVYLSDVENIDPATVAGKIVVFDVPLTEIPTPAFLLLQYPGTVYDPDGEVISGGTYKRPYLNGLVPVIDQLQEAGAIGAVGVLDYPEDAVTGSYFPYDGILRDIPGVFVDRQVGAQLKAQAAQGVTANVVMNAQVEEATTRNLVVVIRGKDYGTTDDEVVMIHSHTDGTNGLEDNGPYMTVAMAQYLNRIPQVERESTYVMFLSSGHFAGGNGVNYFLQNPDTAANPNHDLYADIIAKTKAAMTIEHVGAVEYDEIDGHMAPTGAMEPGVWWSRDHAGLITGAANQLKGGGLSPGGVLLPLGEALGEADGSSGEALWPGEGQYLQAGGIADINYITGPTYLLNYGITTTDKVDFDRVRAAAISMTDQALYYGSQTEEQLTKSRGLLGLGPIGLLYKAGILGKLLGSLGLF